ncbi:54S ribosomal protein L27, mitochondrial [Trichoderma asperellum]|uniref:Large ribosomal subunit protein bL27m n=1 Tax=Trichoderma asperellum TaxID=101201 RepID=A0A6V8QTD9_TRIAP|nr:54S ribosomal protein L27, mitochondrial [Trichoderma asperellum]
MRLFTIQRPILAAVAAISRPTIAGSAVAPLGAQLANVLAEGRRNASVKAQGAYKKKSKRGIPNKLGAKRTGGENCIMGRDHTIHSMATGYVKYYRDPAKHPDRKYIGVVFNKEDTLPYPQHAERKRRLNKTVHTIRTEAAKPELSPSGIPFEVTRVEAGEPDRLLRLRADYSYREDNWRIGRLVKTTGLKTTRFRTRKQWFRHRRWRREREISGQREAEKKRAESGGEKVVKAISKKAAKKAAKKAGKKAK